MNLAEVLDGYVTAALWSTHDGDGDPLDAGYSVFDIDEESIAKAKNACALFVVAAGPLLDDMDPGQVGHDLWLTRNHHGVGFWDRGLGDKGEALTRLADAIGESDLYVGDDDRLYFS